MLVTSVIRGVLSLLIKRNILSVMLNDAAFPIALNWKPKTTITKNTPRDMAIALQKDYANCRLNAGLRVLTSSYGNANLSTKCCAPKPNIRKNKNNRKYKNSLKDKPKTKLDSKKA